MAAVFISSIYGKGYTTVGQRNKVLIYCGIVSFVLLLIIYGSLLYMGAVSVVTMRRISAVRNS